MRKKTLAEKTIKSTKFWPAVGSTVVAIGSAAVGLIDPLSAVQLVVAAWIGFGVSRGIEDGGAAASAKD